MTTFDANGKMTSCFMPPRDEDGNVLSYAEVRARQGIPIGPEEQALREDVCRLSDEYTSTSRTLTQGERWTPNDAFFRLIEAERKVAAIQGPLYDAWNERRRSDLGAPISDEERAAQAEVRAIATSHSWPWKPDELRASNEAHERLRLARKAAFEFWDVDDPDRHGSEEWERRMDTIARAKAGLSPLVPPEDVTYDDEPEFMVRVPLLASVGLPSGGAHPNTPDGEHLAQIHLRAVERWLAETAREPLESVPAEPPVGFSTPREST